MLIAVRRSNARSPRSLGFKPILSKRADCRSPAGGGVHAGGGVAVEKDEEEKTRVGRRARPRTLLQLVQRGSDGQRLLATGRRPLIVRTTQMEAAITEDTVPIQNDFPTYEKEERDRAEP
jgi:hypothetical protein